MIDAIRSMRPIRLITIAVLHITAGCMTSIMVAAGCAVWSGPTTLSWTGWQLEHYPTEWVPIADHFRNLPPVDRAHEQFARLEPLLPASSRAEAYAVTPPETLSSGVRVVRSPGFQIEGFGLSWGTGSFWKEAEIEIMTVGWPKPCLAARRTTDQGFVMFAPWTDAIAAPAWLKPIAPQYPFDPARVIPTRPLAWGLAVNTVVYASALFLMTSVLRPLVRLLRRRRNCCPACNYDRRGLAIDAPCPECGTS